MNELTCMIRSAMHDADTARKKIARIKKYITIALRKVVDTNGELIECITHKGTILIYGTLKAIPLDEYTRKAFTDNGIHVVPIETVQLIERLTLNEFKPRKPTKENKMDTAKQETKAIKVDTLIDYTLLNLYSRLIGVGNTGSTEAMANNIVTVFYPGIKTTIVPALSRTIIVQEEGEDTLPLELKVATHVRGIWLMTKEQFGEYSDALVNSATDPNVMNSEWNDIQDLLKLYPVSSLVSAAIAYKGHDADAQTPKGYILKDETYIKSIVPTTDLLSTQSLDMYNTPNLYVSEMVRWLNETGISMLVINTVSPHLLPKLVKELTDVAIHAGYIHDGAMLKC